MMETKHVIGKINVIEPNDKLEVVTKILYGIDATGFAFIYFKMKNLAISPPVYLKDNFVVMYQKPNSDNLYITNRMNNVISYIKKLYDISEERMYKGKKTFFIKDKVFTKYSKIVIFYNNLIKGLITELQNNISPKLASNINDDFSKKYSVLNYYYDQDKIEN